MADRAVSASPMALPPKREAISARIIPWDDHAGIGIAYDFQGEKHQAHSIANDDWLIIRRLEEAGKLTYSSDALRQKLMDAR
jgi:hypothetical protein